MGEDRRLTAAERDAARHFFRHFVSLAGSYQAIDAAGQPIADAEAFCYSGFLLRVGDRLALVTAGHILEDLDRHLADKTIAITSCRLLDCWGNKARFLEPPPFDYEGADRIWIYHNEYGLDFALIHLSLYYERLLEKNGVEAIPRENWIPRDNIKFDEYILLGIPDEKIIRLETGIVPVPIIVPISAEETPPEHEKHYPRFCGRIPQDFPLKSCVGLSGGPIFGLGTATDGKRRYWTVAVQSKQHKYDHKLIFACPLPVFMGLIELATECGPTDAT